MREGENDGEISFPHKIGADTQRKEHQAQLDDEVFLLQTQNVFLLQIQNVKPIIFAFHGADVGT